MKVRLIFCVLVVSGILRFWDLGNLPMGLHWDEMDAGYQALSLLKIGKDYHGNTLPVFAHSFADYRAPVIIYSTVPAVALFGLNDWSVRIPSAIFGLITVLGIGILAYKLTKNYRIGLLSSLVLGLSPWHIQYSRQAVETPSMLAFLILGMALLINKNWKLAGLMLGLSSLAYSPAKLFVPLIFAVYLFKAWKKEIIVGVLIFSSIASIAYLDSIFGKSGMRFSELAVITDPTVKDWVSQKRLEFALGSGAKREVGMTPSFWSKLEFNKLTKWGTWITSNYLSAFSTDFLFIKGDFEIRHSPSKEMIGQFHLVEFFTLVLGVSVILTGKYYLILAWLLLAPISASLTRDGANHAARLSVMMPAVAVTIAIGWEKLMNLKPASLQIGLNSLYLMFYIFNVGFYVLYFFNMYRLESSVAFQYGQKEVIEYINSVSNKYEKILLDGHDNSFLMAYLYYSAFDPTQFQKMIPLNVVRPNNSEIHGEQLVNIYTLRPMGKKWSEELKTNNLKNTLIVTTSDQINKDVLKFQKTIYYPSGEIAYLIFYNP